MGKWLLALVVLVIVFGGIFGGKAWQDKRAAAAAAAQQYPAAAIGTAHARQADWPSELRAIGTLRAVDGTQVTAQVAGNVTEIGFSSGARVKKGELLVQLDQSTQLAALRANEARRDQAHTEMERARRLYQTRAVSQQEFQRAEMEYKTAAAAVQSDRALLAKLRITAPFDGVLGIRQVSLGQYVAPGTPIVDLQRYQPILLDFALPQEWLGHIEPGQTVQFAADAWPERSFAGAVSAIDAQVDVDTRNIKVQATLENADELLRPGLFGQVTLALGQKLQGVEVPHTAISYSTFGDTVYVVSDGAHDGQEVQAQVVEILAERDGKALLAAGSVGDGAEVATVGLNKLRDGAPVQVRNDDARALPAEGG